MGYCLPVMGARRCSVVCVSMATFCPVWVLAQCQHCLHAVRTQHHHNRLPAMGLSMLQKKNPIGMCVINMCLRMYIDIIWACICKYVYLYSYTRCIYVYMYMNLQCISQVALRGCHKGCPHSQQHLPLLAAYCLLIMACDLFAFDYGPWPIT